MKEIDLLWDDCSTLFGGVAAGIVGVVGDNYRNNRTTGSTAVAVAVVVSDDADNTMDSQYIDTTSCLRIH